MSWPSHLRESTGVLSELHFSTVDTTENHTDKLIGSIHGCTADFAHMGQREDVRDGVRVEPDFAEVGKVANEFGVLKAAVSYGAEQAGAGVDDAEHIRVLKD